MVRPVPDVRPRLGAGSQHHNDIVFGKVDTEVQIELAQAFGVSSIPTLMALRDGVVLYAQPGALPETALEQLIEQVRGVDMDEVRHTAQRRPSPTAG